METEVKRGGLSKLKIGVTLLVMTILLVAFSYPFWKSRGRSNCSGPGQTTLNGARQLDAAIDQWSIEYGVDEGVPIDLKGIAAYVKPGSSFEAALVEGIAPTDAHDNPYVFGVTGPNQIKIHPKTHKKLEGVVTDWFDF